MSDPYLIRRAGILRAIADAEAACLTTTAPAIARRTRATLSSVSHDLTAMSHEGLIEPTGREHYQHQEYRLTAAGWCDSGRITPPWLSPDFSTQEIAR